ncbi:hypothetical protein PPTG_24317 [Phytophthora nicotianae INRA-310]|uniref:Uncharacterized protein n=1 Tax=Phytophthora nicotianae (strain INRA-310) TaxID=761204 RepID=W2PGW0_PHYN3|nr:hypothetical protein PPTG_24317 [Phytophthora nicotianae INRA-310]ETN00122.1 hypothetical protein PPTG_24317 [Phytophthora nicotianae INRA-310]
MAPNAVVKHIKTQAAEAYAVRQTKCKLIYALRV